MSWEGRDVSEKDMADIMADTDISACDAYARHLPVIDADIIRIAADGRGGDGEFPDAPSYSEMRSIIYLWFGDEGVTDYGGDDWDDAPYEHNAGHVSDEYVHDIVRIALPLGLTGVEPADGYENSPFCKDDLKSGIAPCVVIVPSSIADLDAAWGNNLYPVCLGSREALRIYHGDDLASILDGIDALARDHAVGGGEVTVSRCAVVDDPMAVYAFVNQDDGD